MFYSDEDKPTKPGTDAHHDDYGQGFGNVKQNYGLQPYPPNVDYVDYGSPLSPAMSAGNVWAFSYPPGLSQNMGNSKYPHGNYVYPSPVDNNQVHVRLHNEFN